MASTTRTVVGTAVVTNGPAFGTWTMDRFTDNGTGNFSTAGVNPIYDRFHHLVSSLGSGTSSSGGLGGVIPGSPGTSSVGGTTSTHGLALTAAVVRASTFGFLISTEDENNFQGPTVELTNFGFDTGEDAVTAGATINGVLFSIAMNYGVGNSFELSSPSITVYWSVAGEAALLPRVAEHRHAGVRSRRQQMDWAGDWPG